MASNQEINNKKGTKAQKKIKKKPSSPPNTNSENGNKAKDNNKSDFKEKNISFVNKITLFSTELLIMLGINQGQAIFGLLISFGLILLISLRKYLFSNKSDSKQKSEQIAKSNSKNNIGGAQDANNTQNILEQLQQGQQSMISEISNLQKQIKENDNKLKTLSEKQEAKDSESEEGIMNIFEEAMESVWKEIASLKTKIRENDGFSMKGSVNLKSVKRSEQAITNSKIGLSNNTKIEDHVPIEKKNEKEIEKTIETTKIKETQVVKPKVVSRLSMPTTSNFSGTKSSIEETKQEEVLNEPPKIVPLPPRPAPPLPVPTRAKSRTPVRPLPVPKTVTPTDQNSGLRSDLI